MSDDEELWAELEAAPLNVWLAEPVTGLWCSKCNLPSVVRYPVNLDPAMPGGSYVQNCETCNPEATK